MARFKAALVGLDGQGVPGWVRTELAKDNIDLTVYECTSDDELARWAGDADLVWLFGGSRILTDRNLGLLARCGAIVRTGSGTDNVPVAEATRRGIVVANTPDALTEAVSDHAVGLLFACLRQIAVQDRLVRSGVWDRYRAWPRMLLNRRTLGLVGFGRIAQMFARKLSGFEVTVLAHDPLVTAETMVQRGARAASIDELLARADVVSLHCPLTEGSRHLINERTLRLMKPTAVLINTARGPVVDEPALARGLAEGWIAAAGLDVLEREPAEPGNPLLRLDNVVITPHIAGYSDEYLETCWRLSVETVVALAGGHWPRSYVNQGVKPRWDLNSPGADRRPTSSYPP